MKLFLIALLFPSLLCAKTLKIAVIDTGVSNTTGLKMCGPEVPVVNGKMSGILGQHGNNIAHIIGDNLKNQDYCIQSINAFSDKENHLSDAVAVAIALKVDVINVSAGGPGGSVVEEAVFTLASLKNISVFIAAGNEGQDLDKDCNYYPACYMIKGINVVGNLNNKLSNHGKVINIWKNGNNVTAGGVIMSGTSQATALATKDYVIKTLREKK